MPTFLYPESMTADLAHSLKQAVSHALITSESHIRTPANAEVLLAAMPPRPANYETVIAVNSGRHDFDLELETGGNSCSTR